MTNGLKIADKQNLQDKIHTTRGLAVMLDRDLAELYDNEFDILRSKISTANFAKTRTN